MFLSIPRLEYNLPSFLLQFWNDNVFLFKRNLVKNNNIRKHENC